MALWVGVMAVGGLLLLWALALVVRQFRRGHVSGLYLFACLLGSLAFCAIVLVEVFAPDGARGATGLVLWLPALIAIVLLVRERRKLRRGQA
jgi:hypothetical protein